VFANEIRLFGSGIARHFAAYVTTIAARRWSSR